MGLSELARKFSGSTPQVARARRLAALGRQLVDLNPGPLGADEPAAALFAALNELESSVESLDGRLIMGLLGGTGVGKSTLISALAGQPISKSSLVRPTTSQPVIYRHQDFDLPRDLEGRDAPHRVDSLRYLAIIDFPDFDSLETSHHQLVLGSLKLLDLVVWVSDHHKYADRRFYQIMKQVHAFLGSEAQVVLLNKADELFALDDGGEALSYVLESFYAQLKEYGGWVGPPPWPVSAREGLERPGDPRAGSLAPLRNLLAELADAKYRRAIEMGNLGAKIQHLLDIIKKNTRPDQWLRELEALKKLEESFQPLAAISGDLAALTLAHRSYIAPKLDHLKRTAKGLLSLYTDGWDFMVNRFKPGPDLPPPAPRPAAPNLVHYLLGREEDLTAVTGQTAALTRKSLAEESSARLWAALESSFIKAKDPRLASALLYIWPLALALLMIWAETGGTYGGPAALLAAIFRSAAPWLIFGFLGDLIISRFIWFRAGRHYESAFHRALDQARADLAELAEISLGRKVRDMAARRTEALNILAALNELENEPVAPENS